MNPKIRFIAILSYAAYQGSIENLRSLGASSVITDLKNSPREQSGIEMAETISDMFLTKSPAEWENVTMGIGKLSSKSPKNNFLTGSIRFDFF